MKAAKHREMNMMELRERFTSIIVQVNKAAFIASRTNDVGKDAEFVQFLLNADIAAKNLLEYTNGMDLDQP